MSASKTSILTQAAVTGHYVAYTKKQHKAARKLVRRGFLKVVHIMRGADPSYRLLAAGRAAL